MKGGMGTVRILFRGSGGMFQKCFEIIVLS